jgi:membrane-associated phospholipid phosphatase
MRPRASASGDRDELQQDAPTGAFHAVPTRAGRWTVGLLVALGRRIGAHPALALTLAVGIGAAFLMSFLVSRVYDAVTERDGVAGLDEPILHAAIALRSPGVDAVAAAVAVLFGPVGMPIMAVAALAVLSVRRRSWTPAILIAAAGIGSLLMTVAGKDIIGRSRPPLSEAIPPFEYSPSFPSGHTLNATVIAGAVGYLLWLRRHAIAARIAALTIPIVIAVAVGVTRVLLGAHWFTDVLAGWLLGAAWLALVITAHRGYLTARRRGAPRRPPRQAARRGAPG